jgi:hypothetical protein
MRLDREFTLRGGRNYLHSAAVIDDLLALRPRAAGEGFDFRFEHRTDRQVRYQDEAPEDRSGIVGAWSDADGTVYVIARDEPIVATSPYDEDGLACAFKFRPDGVHVPSDLAGYTTIEAIIAGFKALLRAGPAGSDVKVVFVRMKCDRLPGLPLRIEFKRKLGAFYQGDIRDEHGYAGQVYYGEWR